MKNTIMYYYKLIDPTIYKKNNKIYVKTKNNVYIFEKVYKEKNIIEIFNLPKNGKYYQFVPNIFNHIITPYKNEKYVLLKLNQTNKKDILTEIIQTPQHTIPQNIHLDINHSDWKTLWSQKNDYLEYQMKHIYGKYPLIDESFDYFLGMAETAINYLEYNRINSRKKQEYITICHRRINDKDFYNPLEIVLDYKERDIGEYIKYLFINNKYNNKELEKIIDQLRYYNIDEYRLFARILYPSYYFDIYDRVINNEVSETEIKKIVNRIEEYENYIFKIFTYLSKNTQMPSIEWIKKRPENY